ncbi:MAG: PHP domain-containing protein [Clostridia bacterium]|nr:PHP domain-containing protein [Clostridia bacterium]
MSDLINFFEGKNIEEGFRLELHLHTSEASKCSHIDARTAVRMYKELGFDGVAITNHFINGNTSIDKNLPWETQMNLFFKGCEEAVDEGERIGLKVFSSFEFNYKSTEFIVLGITKEWMINHPEVMNMTPDEFIPFFQDNGAYVIQVHPYRDAWYISTKRPYAYLVDAIEVINAGNWNPDNDIKALRIARLFNKPMTAGSDCHNYGNAPKAGVVLKEVPKDDLDLIRILRKNEHTVFGREDIEFEAEYKAD